MTSLNDVATNAVIKKTLVRKNYLFVVDNCEHNLELICGYYGVNSIDELINGTYCDDVCWDFGDDVRYVELMYKPSSKEKVIDLCRRLTGNKYSNGSVGELYRKLNKVNEFSVGFSILDDYTLSNNAGGSIISVFVYCE